MGKEDEWLGGGGERIFGGGENSFNRSMSRGRGRCCRVAKICKGRRVKGKFKAVLHKGGGEFKTI